MKTKMLHLWQDVESSFWFIPALLVLCALGLASFLIRIDTTVDLALGERWPLIFGAGAAGSRGLLSAVATSMVTVAGVVFSITIVVLALTASQYTSRVLRHFMRNRINQVVLGVFLGIFAYCLVVLRIVREGDAAFVPSMAVLVSLILSFVGIAFLIYFIHHVAMSIQASCIIASVAHETITAIDRIYPLALKQSEHTNLHPSQAISTHTWVPVLGQHTGYIERIDNNTLFALADTHKTVFRMERGIGEFSVEGTPLIMVAGSSELAQKLSPALKAAYYVRRQRSLHQDAAFGIRQIVDIAIRALSSGMNDMTTAVMCVDYLGAILVRLATRQIAPSLSPQHKEARVIYKGPSFEGMLAEAFDQIRQLAEGNLAVLTSLLQALENIAGQTTNAQRLQALAQHRDLIASAAERAIRASHERDCLKASLQRLSKII